MKHKYYKAAIAALLSLLLLSGSAVYAVGDVTYVNSRMLANNLEYVNTLKWSSAFGRTESFSVSITGPGDAYPTVMVGDTVFGSAEISSIVDYAESLGLNVLAAVNADFFSLQTGIPLGIVIENGIYVSSPSDRDALCFGYGGGAYFVSTPQVMMTLQKAIAVQDYADGEDAEILYAPIEAAGIVAVDHFNKYRTETGGLYMYSEKYSSVSTRTSTAGWFVKFKILEGEPTVSGTMLLEVTETLTSNGSIPIGEGYMVLSSAMAGGHISQFEEFTVGDLVILATHCEDETLAEAAYATGMGDVIVADGIMTDPDSWDKALLTRNPRTAFGIRDDGAIVSYAVDGRDSTHSVGLTMEELAEEMIRIGCRYAVNLDGGGSTALCARMPGEGVSALISKPSGGSERGCATYIVFVTDMKPDGEVSRLCLQNDGIIVLAGSSVELVYAASDGGYMPVDVPDDVLVIQTGMDGSHVEGFVYTAGYEQGFDELTLYSPSADVYGKGQIYVITRPTSITPVLDGGSRVPGSVSLFPGETLEIDAISTYYRRSVVSQPVSLTYDILGDVGEMLMPGVFKAGSRMRTGGSIIVSAGGRSATIRVEIEGFLDTVSHWASEYIEYLAWIGLVTGVTRELYDPERMMSRGDFCLLLYRAAGTPDYGHDPGDGDYGDDGDEGDEGDDIDGGDDEAVYRFDDVPAEAYYAQAINWAYESGIAEALMDNDFYPAQPLTRQDTFTWIYRALGILGIEYEDGAEEDLSGFSDADDLAQYAAMPTATLIKLGLVNGMDGMLNPEGNLTRAQMAKIIATVMLL